jgi:DHA2 family multidrug resistance protein-like MFS transporter
MLSAALLTIASWPSLFLAHLPLGALALASSRDLPSTAGTGGKIDLVGIFFSAAGFCALLLGLGALAGATFTPAIMIAGGIVCFLAVARRSRGLPAPVIPLDLLRQRTFRLSVVASICCFIAQTAGLLAVSFYLQDVLGLTPLMTGIYMTPWPVAVAFAAIVAARVLHRRPDTAVAPIGAAILAAGLAGAATAALMADPLLLGACSALCGIGFGLFQVANNRVLFLSALLERSAAAGGLQGTARLTGQATGAVVVALLFNLAPLASALGLALIISSILAVVSSVVSRQRSSLTNPSPTIC